MIRVYHVFQVGKGQPDRSALPRANRVVGASADAARQDPMVHRRRLVGT